MSSWKSVPHIMTFWAIIEGSPHRVLRWYGREICSRHLDNLNEPMGKAADEPVEDPSLLHDAHRRLQFKLRGAVQYPASAASGLLCGAAEIVQLDALHLAIQAPVLSSGLFA